MTSAEHAIQLLQRGYSVFRTVELTGMSWRTVATIRSGLFPDCSDCRTEPRTDPQNDGAPLRGWVEQGADRVRNAEPTQLINTVQPHHQ